MSDLHMLLSWVGSIVVGFLLGQSWFWMKRNYHMTKELKDSVFCYNETVKKMSMEMNTRIVILETRSEMRKTPESFGPNNFILPEVAKKRPGRPPKKVEIKNP